MDIADQNQWMVLGRTLGSLILVVGLILTLAWLAQKYFQPEKWAKTFGSKIRIVQSLPLGNKSKLLLIDVHGKRLLLGQSAQGISLVSEIEKVEDESSVSSLDLASCSQDFSDKENIRVS